MVDLGTAWLSPLPPLLHHFVRLLNLGELGALLQCHLPLLALLHVLEELVPNLQLLAIPLRLFLVVAKLEEIRLNRSVVQLAYSALFHWSIEVCGGVHQIFVVSCSHLMVLNCLLDGINLEGLNSVGWLLKNAE